MLRLDRGQVSSLLMLIATNPGLRAAEIDVVEGKMVVLAVETKDGASRAKATT